MIYVVSTTGAMIRISETPNTWGELKQVIVAKDPYLQNTIDGFKAVINRVDGQPSNTTLEFNDARIPSGNVSIVLVQAKLQGAAFTDEALIMPEFETLDNILSTFEDMGYKELRMTATSLKAYCADNSNSSVTYSSCVAMFSNWEGRNYTNLSTDQLFELVSTVAKELYDEEIEPRLNTEDAIPGAAVSTELTGVMLEVKKQLSEMQDVININVSMLNEIARRINNLEDHFGVIDKSREQEIAAILLKEITELK